MGRNLQAVVFAAGITALGVCLVGCKSDTSWSNNKTAYAEGGTISGGTGVTGSSASPYTRDKPAPRAYPGTTVYTQSPYAYYPAGYPYQTNPQTNPPQSYPTYQPYPPPTQEKP
jgi:hypothetical protein